MTPGSLESASLTTWTTQLTAVEAHAAERDQYATDLVVQVAEPMKQSATQYEELRKCHVDFHGKLEKERDASYNDLKKMKGKYDGACQEVETRRKKMESSFDHNKPKAQAAYQQQILEMNNVKVGNWVPFYPAPCRMLTVSEHILDHHQRDQQAKGAVLPRICPRAP